MVSFSFSTQVVECSRINVRRTKDPPQYDVPGTGMLELTSKMGSELVTTGGPLTKEELEERKNLAQSYGHCPPEYAVCVAIRMRNPMAGGFCKGAICKEIALTLV